MKEKEKELSPVVAKKQTATTRDPADVVWYDASQDVWCDSINEMRAQRETCADDWLARLTEDTCFTFTVYKGSWTDRPKHVL
jgi:hypothetical protein